MTKPDGDPSPEFKKEHEASKAERAARVRRLADDKSRVAKFHQEEMADGFARAERADYGLTEKYRMGVRQACGRSVFRKFEEEVGSPGRVADRFAISRSQVSKLRDGIISSDHIFAFLSELRWKCEDLDDLPDITERAVRGYQVAIHFLRNDRTLPRDKIYPTEDDQIAGEVFFSIVRTLSSSVFCRLKLREDGDEDLSEEDWGMVAEDVARGLEMDSCSIPFRNGTDLRRMFVEWKSAVWDCLCGIPYRWAKELET